MSRALLVVHPAAVDFDEDLFDALIGELDDADETESLLYVIDAEGEVDDESYEELYDRLREQACCWLIGENHPVDEVLGMNSALRAIVAIFKQRGVDEIRIAGGAYSGDADEPYVIDHAAISLEDAGFTVVVAEHACAQLTDADEDKDDDEEESTAPPEGVEDLDFDPE